MCRLVECGVEGRSPEGRKVNDKPQFSDTSARNIVGPLDFLPMVLHAQLQAIPLSNPPRPRPHVTTPSLLLPVSAANPTTLEAPEWSVGRRASVCS